ncbi:nitrate- and nitrite sensing domain-containing protein [Nocardiopsis sp. NPDC057823]|uniref:sensor histidine kinase n=1 Tax=Nocardiopsis sp. NPDC057823 TaxID=3346256 RepID=UPI0036735866
MRRTRVKASTIRGQLNRIVLVPSLCFLALWLIVAAVGTVQAVRLMGAVVQAREGTEVFAAAVLELRSERRMGLVHLGRLEAGEAVDTEALREQRSRTDAAVADAVGFAGRLEATRDDEVRRSADAFTEAAETLPALRTALDDGSAVQEQILVGYAEVLDGATAVTTALVHTTDGGENLTDAVLTSELLRAAAEYSTADALLAGVAARGTMGYEETAHFTYLTASYRDTLAEAAPLLSPAVGARQEEMAADPAWIRAEDISRGVVTRSPATAADDPGQGSPPEWNTAVDVDVADWDESSGASVALIDELARAQADRTVDLAWRASLAQVSFGVAAALVSLAGGAIALATVRRSSRRLTDRLALLRERVMERDDDLPDIVERAQRGDRVDAHEELPPLDEFGDDEIGQVAEAFDSAQLTAVEAAVRQAEIRRGANKAFLGIAFRNQNLVQRQLRLLDEIEYDEQDPEALGRLFRLDHLTTRARRYADNLIILGGGQSARRWRQPRPLVDVLRAAIAETEDFERVRLTSAPRMLMHGQAVADIVHLLAELIENATQFSPAGTPVDVGCGPCPEGLLVEVEDRGLGMSEHGYEQARRTLARPPEFDVMALPDDPRLGLFVVARLAERHGVRVWLEPSPYGGTRAITLVPKSLLEPADAPPAAGPRGVVPAAAAPAEGDVRRAFGLSEARTGAAPAGVRPEREPERWAAPEGGPDLRPVAADGPDTGDFAEPDPRTGTPPERVGPSGAPNPYTDPPRPTGPRAAFAADGPVEPDPRPEPVRDTGPRPAPDPGTGRSAPHSGAIPVTGPRTASGGGETGPHRLPGTGAQAAPGDGTGVHTGPVRSVGPRAAAGDAPGGPGPDADRVRTTGPQAPADPRPPAGEPPRGPHPADAPGEIDLFAEPPAFEDVPAGERRPRYSADPGPGGPGPDTGRQWDVRWGDSGPQEVLGDLSRHHAEPRHRTDPFRATGPGAVPGAPGGYPGDPTEPLPHLTAEHRRPDPAPPRPGTAPENGRPAPRRDLPPGFTGPRPVGPDRGRLVGPWPDGAPTAPFPAPEGRPADGDPRGVPDDRAEGPRHSRRAPDGPPDPERAPLPKRPVPRERDVPRVPAPTPPGGHSEP